MSQVLLSCTPLTDFDLRSPSLWFEHSRFRNLLTMTLGSLSQNLKLFYYILTNGKYPRKENIYKMIVDHLYRMAHAIYRIFLEIGLSVNEISKITTRSQTPVCKNTKINLEAHTNGRK